MVIILLRSPGIDVIYVLFRVQEIYDKSLTKNYPSHISLFQILTFLFPAGLYYCFKTLTDHNIFIILYGVTSVYFAGVMVRLMLVLAPVMCIVSGIAVSSSLSTYMKYLEGSTASTTANAITDGKKFSTVGGGKRIEGSHTSGKWSGGKVDEGKSQKEMVATAFVTMLTFFLVTYAFHCVWATSEAYSSPSIVLTARTHDGTFLLHNGTRVSDF